jgi:6-phosphogluconolactonase
MSNVLRGFIGTYTHGNHDGKSAMARGIYAFSYDSQKGVMDDIHLAAMSLNPSWLTVSPSGKYLYAVNEVHDFHGEKSGALSSYRIDKAGNISFINQVKSFGMLPCHIAVEEKEAYLIVTNYESGILAVFPINSDGGLADPSQTIQFYGKGPHRDRQQGPRAHSVWFDKSKKRILVCDLGTDRVMCYNIVKGPEPIKPAEVPWYSSLPAVGPRHLAFNPAGTVVYMLGEMGSTVEVLKYNPSAKGCWLERIQSISTLPKGYEGVNNTASIRVSGDGKVVYASNRGHDSIVVFKVAEKDGSLKFVGAYNTEGNIPRDFTLDPAGNFLIAGNQNSDSITIFSVNKSEGVLTKVREYPVPAPVCVIFC